MLSGGNGVPREHVLQQSSVYQGLDGLTLLEVSRHAGMLYKSGVDWASFIRKSFTFFSQGSKIIIIIYCFIFYVLFLPE